MKQQMRLEANEPPCCCGPVTEAKGRGVAPDKIRLFRAALRILERGMERSLDAQTECCGVTVAQCHVLMELDGVGCVNLTTLAAGLGLDKSTLSRSVDGLVNSGLVDRSIDPDNRRQQVICLSPVGRARVDAIHARCDDEYQKLFGVIPKAKHDMVCEAVEILAQAMAKQRSGVK